MTLLLFGQGPAPAGLDSDRRRVGVVLLAPQSVIDRFGTMLDPKKDLTTIDRRAMLEAGVAIVKTSRCSASAPIRSRRCIRAIACQTPSSDQPHLHNVPMQSPPSAASSRSPPGSGSVSGVRRAVPAGRKARNKTRRRGARRDGRDARRRLTEYNSATPNS